MDIDNKSPSLAPLGIGEKRTQDQKDKDIPSSAVSEAPSLAQQGPSPKKRKVRKQNNSQSQKDQELIALLSRLRTRGPNRKTTEDAIKKSITNGANVNIKNKNGDTPLHFACRSRIQELCAFLIENGANINAQNRDGETPLYAYKASLSAVAHRPAARKEMLDLFINHPECDLSILGNVVYDIDQQYFIHNIDKMLELGCDLFLDCPSAIWRHIRGSIDLDTKKNILQAMQFQSIDQYCEYGDSPLHVLIGDDSVELLQIALDKNPEFLNAQNKVGYTPLTLALAFETLNLGIIEFLLQQGANPNIPNKRDGLTGVHNLFYGKRGNQEYNRLIELVLRYGGDVNHVNSKTQRAPWMYAMDNLHVDFANLCETCDVNLNLLDNHENTVLHIAVLVNLERVQWVLQNCTIDINAKNKFNNTPLGELVSRIWNQRGNPNRMDLPNFLSMVEVLVESGADCMAEVRYGHNKHSIARLLIAVLTTFQVTKNDQELLLSFFLKLLGKQGDKLIEIYLDDNCCNDILRNAIEKGSLNEILAILNVAVAKIRGGKLKSAKQ